MWPFCKVLPNFVVIIVIFISFYYLKIFLNSFNLVLFQFYFYLLLFVINFSTS